MANGWNGPTRPAAQNTKLKKSDGRVGKTGKNTGRKGGC